MSVTVRRAATAEEIEAAGELTAQAYQADRLIDPADAYLDELTDARRRAREAILLVAVVPGGAGEDRAGESRSGDAPDVVVGTITMAPHGTSYAETAEPGELELRMLAVAPEARNRGVAETLMRATAREAALLGFRRLVLSTMDSMVAAQRLYVRLGWTRVPERDWGHVEIHLRVFTWEAPLGPSPGVERATWPPVHVEEVDGFSLGMSEGVTRRANCAIADGSLGERDTAELDASFSRIEAAYRLAGLTPCVRVDDAATGELLVARGYLEVTPTLVLVCDLHTAPGSPDLATASSGGAAPGGSREPQVGIEASREPDGDWLHIWLDGRTASSDTARAILTGTRARYLAATEDGRLLGIVRVATAPGDDGVSWAAVSCLAVVPDARRRGIGRSLTKAALDEARRLGADKAFVQVLARNDGALELVERAGFAVASAYRYAELDRD